MGETALFVSTEKRQLNCLKEFLNAGTEVNIPDDEGDTALIRAIQNEHYECDCAREIITAGAAINMQNNYFDTSFMYSIQKGNTDRVKELI